MSERSSSTQSFGRRSHRPNGRRREASSDNHRRGLVWTDLFGTRDGFLEGLSPSFQLPHISRRQRNYAEIAALNIDALRHGATGARGDGELQAVGRSAYVGEANNFMMSTEHFPALPVRKIISKAKAVVSLDKSDANSFQPDLDPIEVLALNVLDPSLASSCTGGSHDVKGAMPSMDGVTSKVVPGTEGSGCGGSDASGDTGGDVGGGGDGGDGPSSQEPNGCKPPAKPSAISDEYGLLGLTLAIRVAKQNVHLTERLFGVDPDDLVPGCLPPAETGSVLSTFRGFGQGAGFTARSSGDSSRGASDAALNFRLPFNSAMRSILSHHNVCSMSDGVLFLMFYTRPREAIQLFSANELYVRGWFLYLPQNAWLRKQTDSSSYKLNDFVEKGRYLCFDSIGWRVLSVEMVIDVREIDERPDVASKQSGCPKFGNSI